MKGNRIHDLNKKKIKIWGEEGGLYGGSKAGKKVICRTLENLKSWQCPWRCMCIHTESIRILQMRLKLQAGLPLHWYYLFLYSKVKISLYDEKVKIQSFILIVLVDGTCKGFIYIYTYNIHVPRKLTCCNSKLENLTQNSKT